jgi:hypothetical protein
MEVYTSITPSIPSHHVRASTSAGESRQPSR